MKRDDRKAAVAAYKQRTQTAGVFAVRCKSTGQVWIGAAPDLDTIQNRLWFTLRQGNDPHRDLQAAWRKAGIEDFTFEVVERFDDEAPGYDRALSMKQRSSHWRAELKAETEML